MEAKLAEINNECRLIEKQLNNINVNFNMIICDLNGSLTSGLSKSWDLDAGSYLIEANGIIKN